MKNEIIVLSASSKNLIKNTTKIKVLLDSSKTKALHIINLTSTEIADKLLREISNIKNVTIWNTNKEIRQSLDAIGLRLIDPLKKIISNNNNYYYSSFFEMNLADNVWKSFVYAQIINNISLKTKSNKVHLFVEDYFLCKSILEITNIKTIFYLKSNLSFYLFEVKHLLKSFFTWIYNLINEVITSIILKSFFNNRSNLSIKKITFAMLRLSWWIDSNKKNSVNYTYTGQHFSKLKKDDLYEFVIISQQALLLL